jgi:hypothetical protein
LPEDAARLAADFVNDMKRKTRNTDQVTCIPRLFDLPFC